MESNPPPPLLGAPNKIRPLIVLRDVVGIFILTAIGGVVIGVAIRLSGRTDLPVALIGLSNVLLSIVGFLIAGCLTRTNRWPHLLLVAVGLWLASAVNLMLGVTLVQWFAAAVVIFIAMGIGGGIASLVARKQD